LFEESVKRINKSEKDLVFGGIPRYEKDSDNLKILHNIGFCVGYSERHKNPIWVSYRLDYMEATDPYKRPGGFKPDPRTDSMVKQKDYTKSGYDRGHMAPNSSISDRFGREAQIETFMMSNITPQKPRLNRKVWQRLESLEADLANKCETIWVVTGPIFDDHIEMLKSGVEVPDAFFKVLIDEKDGKLRALPFIIPQTVKGRESLEQFLTSIDQIEEQAGIDLFWAISDRYENYLEAQIPTRIW
jgi:endonuclease G